MDREMGYRNMLAVEELASQGKLTVTHKAHAASTSLNTPCSAAWHGSPLTGRWTKPPRKSTCFRAPTLPDGSKSPSIGV